eukprot:11977860-Prorocentrum_lima.AAC.1
MSVNFVTHASSTAMASAALSSVCGGGVADGAEDAAIAEANGAEAAGSHRWVANSVETERLLPTPR